MLISNSYPNLFIACFVPVKCQGEPQKSERKCCVDKEWMSTPTRGGLAVTYGVSI